MERKPIEQWRIDVGTKVIGWFHGERHERWYDENEERTKYISHPAFRHDDSCELFAPDQNANHDLLVRDAALKWIFSKRQKFIAAVDLIWQNALLLDGGISVEVLPDRALRYRPGDYARAAMSVLNGAEQ